MTKELIEKYDLWLLSRYNLIGQTEIQVTIINTILSKFNIKNFDSKDLSNIIAFKPEIMIHLDDNIDTFGVKDLNKLAHMRLAIIYFIEFIIEENTTVS